MSDRNGVLLLMFDLPMLTSSDRRNYTLFRKNIIRAGYRFFQKSVYVKLLRNVSSINDELDKIIKILPPEGSIHVLPLNMNTFRDMECLIGDPFDMALFSDDVVFIGDDDEGEELLF